eukprot:7199875-Pyramimonas_sp.AAC.1
MTSNVSRNDVSPAMARASWPFLRRRVGVPPAIAIDRILERDRRGDVTLPPSRCSRRGCSVIRMPPSISRDCSTGLSPSISRGCNAGLSPSFACVPLPTPRSMPCCPMSASSATADPRGIGTMECRSCKKWRARRCASAGAKTACMLGMG